MVLGLEILPKQKVEYRGRTLEEFDLDAALARKPAVLLVDELAHTNAPGSRHAKRWQDVDELLDAGIDVLSTMNVQHVESLNDVVAQITHVQVRETVPDSVLDRADEIELVDIAPEELLQRLKDGKVYLRDQAAAGDHALLSARKPARASRARPPPHRAARRRRRARVPRRARRRLDLAGGRANSGVRRPRAELGALGPGRGAHGGRAALPLGGGLRRADAGGGRAKKIANGSRLICGWPRRSARR